MQLWDVMVIVQCVCVYNGVVLESVKVAVISLPKLSNGDSIALSYIISCEVKNKNTEKLFLFHHYFL